MTLIFFSARVLKSINRIACAEIDRERELFKFLVTRRHISTIPKTVGLAVISLESE